MNIEVKIFDVKIKRQPGQRVRLNRESVPLGMTQKLFVRNTHDERQRVALGNRPVGRQTHAWTQNEIRHSIVVGNVEIVVELNFRRGTQGERNRPQFKVVRSLGPFQLPRRCRSFTSDR